MKRWPLVLKGLVLPVLLVTHYELAGLQGWINQSILPRPSRIGATFLELFASGELFQHLGISLLRVMQGFAIGGSLGLTLGILIGLSRRADQYLSGILGFLRPIPIMAWIPLLILWLGIDEASKVTAIAIGSFWPVLLNTIQGVRSADRKFLEVAFIFRKTRLQILFGLILPSALPAIFTGARLGVGFAWMCVVGAELIAAASGIGYLIMYARELSQPDVMFVGVLSIGLIGLLIDLILQRVERRLLRWNASFAR